MNYLVIVAPVCAVVALLFALIKAKSILKLPEGNEKATKLSAIIRKGANAFLERQYFVVCIFFGIMFVILGILALCDFLNPFIPFAFLTGGVFSGLSGFLGMKIATASNARTATAASHSLNKGLKVAFSAGSVMGFVVVGLGLLDMSMWYGILRLISHVNDYGIVKTADFISSNMVTFGLGASCMALFSRVGGGIFTKAADVGADLVGKVESNIPEDDHRNPAVIADNVGDNVGDVAGMGADLYESYVGSIVSAIALGFAAFTRNSTLFGGKPLLSLIIPLVIASIGIICSLIGTFFVKTKEGSTQKNLLMSLRKGTYLAGGLTALSTFAFIMIVCPKQWYLYIAILIGLAAGILIGYFTEYFTSDTYKPTKNLAKSAENGTGPVIINGLSLGMLSTLIPVLIIAVAIIASFFICKGNDNTYLGLYGIALAAVGMLSTLGITLSTDAYGPIADNAGGIAQMADMDPVVRERTDALDSLGNTTAATGKGFAIGSAMLTALALLSSFIVLIPNNMLDLSLNNPKVLVGVFIGCMLPFLFSSLTMSAVGKSAESVVIEVRRQFRDKKGILTGEEEPDYGECVRLCTKSSQRQMILPAVIAVVSPIIVGFFLGVNAVAGLLLGSICCGFLLAVMMSNSGGAWDNAKKYIESGNHGGKGSNAHKSAVVGDTVGDPFKDTSGPSINILIKLISIVAIVFAEVLISFPTLF